jgi:hypothetical protein
MVCVPPGLVESAEEAESAEKLPFEFSLRLGVSAVETASVRL